MSGLRGLPPPKPIPRKDRASIACVEKGNIDVIDGAFVVVDKIGIRPHLPIGGFACLMLEPGARISHAAVALAAHAGTLGKNRRRPVDFEGLRLVAFDPPQSP